MPKILRLSRYFFWAGPGRAPRPGPVAGADARPASRRMQPSPVVALNRAGVPPKNHLAPDASQTPQRFSCPRSR